MAAKLCGTAVCHFLCQSSVEKLLKLPVAELFIRRKMCHPVMCYVFGKNVLYNPEFRFTSLELSFYKQSVAAVAN